MTATNPWDLTNQSNQNVQGGLISTAVTPAQPAATTVPGTVANTDGTTFPAAEAATGQAAGYTASQRSVDPSKETVAGQMQGLISANSPFMQQARTSALQQMNSRGVLNSSMAQSAADAAAYQAAIPIAQADAGIYNDAATKNLAYQNEALKSNTAAANDMTKANLSTWSDTMKANMDSATKTQLATIEADYKTTMQNSATAAELYKQTVKNISDIFTNQNMTAEAKNKAVENQIYMMKQGFQIAGAIGNMDLGSLLDFSNVPLPTGSTSSGTGGTSYNASGSASALNTKAAANLMTGVSSAAGVNSQPALSWSAPG